MEHNEQSSSLFWCDKRAAAAGLGHFRLTRAAAINQVVQSGMQSKKSKIY
jgi:hypothetical protein